MLALTYLHMSATLRDAFVLVRKIEGVIVASLNVEVVEYTLRTACPATINERTVAAV